MDPRLQHGVDLFNRREFFVCHEVLEEIWTHERNPRRLFLQAVIHFAVAFYHDQRGNPVGASRQLRKGLRKLAPYLPDCEGIDTAQLHRDALAAVERTEAGATLAGYPRIHLAHTAAALET
jgi:predicted metal-dependent hydrolase